MALSFRGALNVPNFTALSTDIASSKITGASLPGATVFLTDTGAWKIILPNLELADYVLPVQVTVSGGSIEIGSVYIDQQLSESVEIAPYYETKLVSVAGTAEPLTATDVYVTCVTIFPVTTNVGNVYVGTSAVDYLTSKQIILTPTSAGCSMDCPLGYKINLNKIYVDVANSGTNGVHFMYLK